MTQQRNLSFRRRNYLAGRQQFGAATDAVFELVFNTSMTATKRFSPTHRIAAGRVVHRSHIGTWASTCKIMNLRRRNLGGGMPLAQPASFRTGARKDSLGLAGGERGVRALATWTRAI